MAFCPSCGLVYPEGHSFCPLDGARLVVAEDPLMGTVLGGKYRVVERIGEGGMGCVYRAQHVHRDRLVAVKVLPSTMSRDEELKERFFREARAANMVRHENIVEVFDLEETTSGLVFMAMELLAGESLEDMLRERGPMDVEAAVHVLRQILLVLGPAHAMGVIHRDLKPDNIFIVPREGDPHFVKILDFGLAYLAREPKLTEKGTILGTPEYMPPEIVVGEPPGPTSDLYSLGCIGYAMVTGRPPFLASNYVRIMSMQVTEPPPPLVDGCPAPLGAIILRLLEKSPGDRHQDAYAVMRELDAFMPPAPVERDSLGHVVRVSDGTRERLEVQMRTSSLPGMVESWTVFTSQSRNLPGSREVVGEMERCTGRLAELGRQLDEVSTTIEVLEDERRDTAHRIRHAIEALASEASTVRDALAGHRQGLEMLVLEIAGIEERLLESLGTLRGIEAPVSTQQLLSGCIELGDLATRRQELEAGADTARREIRRLQSQLDDVTFQIEALRGRLSSLNVEIDDRVDRQKAILAVLEEERAGIEARLCSLSSRIGD
jgi:serine/threonine-protein kinase